MLLFDLYHTGHHGQYVRLLTEYWARHALPGCLEVAVSHEFGARYPDIVASADGQRLAVHLTEAPVQLREKTGRLAVLQNDLRIGRVLQRVVERHRPDHVVLLHADHLQLSLATRLRFAFPVRLSGIYFRSSFYYREAGRGPASARAVLDDVQKRTLLRLALRNPHLDTLFSLDPYAVGPIRRLGETPHVVALPEAVSAGPALAETPAETRARLGLESGREMVLLFGSLDARKGVRQLLDALARLPEPLARRVGLVMAGESVVVQSEVADALAALRRGGAVQTVHLNAFVPDDEMHRLFRAAALVALPYQRHVGSSGVLVRAAAAGVPVLGQQYGMMGALIHEHRLGLAVDTASPTAIAEGLARFLNPSAHFPFDARAAQAFADANTEDALASTVFDHVLGDTWSPGDLPGPHSAS